MKKIFKIFWTASAVFCAIIMSAVVYYNFSIPDKFYTSASSGFAISSDSLLFCDSSAEKGDKLVMKNLGENEKSTVKLLGLFPIKTVKVNVEPQRFLTPCGNPFGIKMLTEGVMVVGISEISTPYGLNCPAKDAGFKIGDVILSIDGKSALDNGTVSKLIENSEGKSLSFEISRGGEKITLNLTPVFCTSTNSYKSGIWVRDSTAGIGTITYYDENTGSFAGLGHAVCDIDTGNILPLLSGDVGPVCITGVIKGTVGTPGELTGNFSSNESIGTILYNTDAGVFGTLINSPTENESIPIAYKQEIEVGKAQIYSTLEGNSPRSYDILIEKIDLNSGSLTKNMVIKVIDEDLLNLSGGIVQGMSGSPIIQNGKLVGAVTHVFVNNPTMGYGIFCENMIYSAENMENKAA